MEESPEKSRQEAILSEERKEPSEEEIGASEAEEEKKDDNPYEPAPLHPVVEDSHANIDQVLLVSLTQTLVQDLSKYPQA